MTEVCIDALLPQEMATRAEYLGVRKAEMPFLKMFMLAVLAGAFISLGAIFATTVSAGGMALKFGWEGCLQFGSAIWGNTFAVGFRLQPGFDPGGCGWGGIIYGQQLNRDGVGQRQGDRPCVVAQLGYCLSGELCRFARDRSAHVPHPTIHVRRELSWNCSITDWCSESKPDLHTSCRTGHTCQWASVSCCLADVQRPQHAG